jgi:glycosyltransferase involved in cell wall biosynthesis
MISSAGAEGRFHLIGWQENTSTVLKALDIFVLPSLNEGMGRVLVEAMFFEKPVIATRVGGVPSLVSDDAGLLIEPASAKAIETAIDELIENPKAGYKGRGKVIAEYSSNIMIERLDALYKEV